MENFEKKKELPKTRREEIKEEIKEIKKEIQEKVEIYMDMPGVLQDRKRRGDNVEGIDVPKEEISKEQFDKEIGLREEISALRIKILGLDDELDEIES